MHNSQTSSDITNILEKNNIKCNVIEEKTKGFDHRIFLVYTDKGDYCVRIPVKEKNKIVAQSWAFKEWKKLGVPVPDIIVVDENYIIEELIQGNDIDETDLTKNQMEQVLLELGKYTHLMHTVNTRGFGYLMEPGIGSKESWREFIEPDFKGTLIENEKHKLISKDELRIAEDAFDNNSHYLDIDYPKLIHADLKQDNIMIKNGILSGIIDASDAMSGDQYYDLAVIRYSYGKDLFETFLKVYGQIDENRLVFYLLYYSNWLIAFYGFINKDEAKLTYAKGHFHHCIQNL